MVVVEDHELTERQRAIRRFVVETADPDKWKTT
jgi:hypothetical protein